MSSSDKSIGMTTFEDEIINIIINDYNPDEPQEVSIDNASKIIEEVAVENLERESMLQELKLRVR